MKYLISSKPVSFINKYLLIITQSISISILLILLLTPGVSVGPNKMIFIWDWSKKVVKGTGIWSDLQQDVDGFNQMIARGNAYPILGKEPSSHPPTTFLLAGLVAGLPWEQASIIWSRIVLALVPISIYLFTGSIWVTLISTPILWLWPPVYYSVGQFTTIWLFGTAVAYYFRDRFPFLSGVGAASGALLKYMPGLILFLYLKKRKWLAVIGMVFLGLLVLGTLFILHPEIFLQYLNANRTASPYYISYIRNASLLPLLYRLAGVPGALLGVLYLALIFLFCLKGDDETHWMVCLYFTIALLPITWLYSLVPLIPVMLWVLRKRNPVAIVLVVLASAMLYYYPGDEGLLARIVCAFTVIMGAALVSAVTTASPSAPTRTSTPA